MFSRLTASLRHSQTILNTAVPGRETIFLSDTAHYNTFPRPAFLSPNTIMRHIKW